MDARVIPFFLLIFAFPFEAWADRDAGRDVFRESCIGCHSIGCSRNGPMLEGIIGRPAGSVADFDGYSDAMKDSGIVWDEDKLDAYLKDPKSVVSGNSMAGFGKIENEQERRDLIEFLVQPDKSLDICF